LELVPLSAVLWERQLAVATQDDPYYSGSEVKTPVGFLYLRCLPDLRQ
jgi:hypothetical protein